uniref:uncharacterized protein LOC122607795 isoform X2 n=1 Tax=Erigeron canadensis TaxID=72917 RepID=UPI001CB943EB|nr:uncharacterized protein LOC122607795 isoform X2 [Erigeron canadensis]
METVVSKQLEADNNHESEVGTSSFVEIATNNASKEAEIKALMIRLYREIMRPMSILSYHGKDDIIDGSGGSKILIDKLARVNAYKEADMELMSRIYNETIRPMILADIEARHQHFLARVQEEFGVNLLTGMIQEYGNTGSTTTGQALQLQFKNGILAPVSTGIPVQGKDNKPFLLVLTDGMSGEIVKTGAVAAIEVEIVVLDGDSNDDEAENSTSGEFSSNIVREWNGKKVLQGKTFLKMKDGVVMLDKISFTHNKDWKGNKRCRLGARPVNADFSSSVKPGMTELFLVEDKRNNMYKKHEIPFLSDPIYRLNKISRRADFYKRLCGANIKTVMDLLTLHAINPKKLQEVLAVHHNTWKVIMDHAQRCKDKNGVYLYHYPVDGQKSHGVVFNVSGQLVGSTADSQFIPCDKLSAEKKADAQKLIVASSESEHWKKVISFIDLPSLLIHLQSHTTLSSLRNNLNVVIPQTIDTHDHTSLISPHVITPSVPIEYCTKSKNNRRYENAGAEGQSQSPKRPASEYSFSNSPKKPRDEHFSVSPTTPSVGTSRTTNTFLNDVEHSDLITLEDVEDDDWMQYVNDFVLDKWKMVVYAVGWISMASKVRKRRMTFCRDDTLICSHDESRCAKMSVLNGLSVG